MSQSQRPQRSLDAGSMPTRRTSISRVTPLNMLIGLVALLIVMVLVMSLVGVGPFSWGN